MNLLTQTDLIQNNGCKHSLSVLSNLSLTYYTLPEGLRHLFTSLMPENTDMYVKHAKKQLFINTKQMNHKPYIYCSSALQAPNSLCKTKDLITGTISVTVDEH